MGNRIWDDDHRSGMSVDSVTAPSRSSCVAGKHTAARLDRESWLALIVGSAAAAVVIVLVGLVWAGRLGVHDFYGEAWPAYRALIHGRPLEFLQEAPGYLGSLILRAPFAVAVGLAGGGVKAVYVATALPCLLVAVAFGVWWSRQQTSGTRRRVSPMVLCALNPVVIVGLIIGHPEEILGAVLVVMAVIFSVRGQAGWAGLLIGVAVINKSWALVAVPVVLAALPVGHRRALITATMTAAAVLLPALLLKQTASASGAAAALAGGTGTIFRAMQLLWWFGGDSPLSRYAHYLIVLIPIPCSAVWWWIRRVTIDPQIRLRQALMLLALVLLLRAALDPWNNIYYHVPFLFALMAFEAGRPARLTTLATLLLVPLILVQDHFLKVAADVQAGYYAVIAVPAIIALGFYLFRPNAQAESAAIRESGAVSGSSSAA